MQVRSMLLILFFCSLIAPISHANQITQTNAVLEVTASGAGMSVFANPTRTAAVIDKLYWGDRVLWLEGSIERPETSIEMLQVALGDGRMGWIVNDSGTVRAEVFYTTSAIGVGSILVVTEHGDGAHLREQPSTSEAEVRLLQAGDELTVVGGPYSAEYQMWWQVETSTEQVGWLIDVAGWYSRSTQHTPSILLEITASTAGTEVFANPAEDAKVLADLSAGDRVLWLEQATDAQLSDLGMLQVALRDGTIGWIFEDENIIEDLAPFYTTPSIRIGTTLTVTPEGVGTILRESTSSSAETLGTLQAGDELSVVGGPYQAEYQMWWRVQTDAGQIGWMLDVADSYVISQ